MRFFSRLFARTENPDRDYADVIAQTASMPRSPRAGALALRHGLSVVDVAWEDTARFAMSAVGPNISDLTIQVHHEGRSTCMPVLRPPNFTDRTGDVHIADVRIPVGNQARDGRPTERIGLDAYLSDLRRHLTVPGSWPGEPRSLLKPGETDVLVSAQACFLPVPKRGEARFNPVLFNYQSRPGAPAVLAILVTREGTSATIIDNQRDGFPTGGRWGQRLFHNARGERASLVGTRITDFVEAGGDGSDAPETLEAAREAGLNQVLLIQVPLLQPEPDFSDGYGGATIQACSAAPARMRRGLGLAFGSSNVEEAVIGHGPLEGPFTEIAGQPIERDPRFPIRVTVQLYQATDDGVVSAADLKRLSAAIGSVYADAHASGCLVLGDAGRSTAWDDAGRGKAEPADWWERFWSGREVATGRSRAELLGDLETLLGRPVPAAILRSWMDDV